MKILLINNFWYRRGGAEAVVLSTRDLLQKAGHQVVCFGFDDPRNEVVLDYAVPIKKKNNGEFAHGWHSIYNAKAKKMLQKCLTESKPDIIHAHNIYHNLSFSVCEAIKESGIPAILTAHDYKLISLQYKLYHHGQIDISTFNNLFLALLKNVMESFPQTVATIIEYIMRRFRGWDKVFKVYLSPSQFLANMLTQHGFEESKVKVVYNPIGDAWITDSHLPFLQKSDILFAGRLEPEKGTRIVEELAHRLPEINFLVAGHGSHIPTGKNITYLGRLSAEQLREKIDKAKIVLLPSLWPENAPMSMVESLARGTVVLGSNVGGVPEWLDNEWLIKDPNDIDLWVQQIEKLYNADPQAIETKISKAQAENCARHSEANYQKQIEAVYQSVL